MFRHGIGHRPIELWRRSRGLRREIALVVLVKTLLLILLFNALAAPPAQRRVGSEGAGRHLLEAVPTTAVEETAHER